MQPRRFIAEILFGALVILGSLLFIDNAGANESVKINLKGNVKERCSIVDFSGEFNFSKTEYQKVDFNLYCNTPFDIGMYSINGGLKNGNKVARYNVSLSLPDLGVNINGDSDAINKNKIFKSVGEILFESKGQIKVHLLDELFYAGSYKEKLIIDIYPKIIM